MPYVWYVSMPLDVTAHIVGCRQVSIYISAWASALLVSDEPGNARASDCVTSRQVISHAFFVYVPIPI